MKTEKNTTDFAFYNYISNKKILKISINNSDSFDISKFIIDVNNQIKRYYIDEIVINNIKSIDMLNEILKSIVYINHSTKITLDLTYGLENISKKSNMIIGSLPSNLTIKTMYSYDNTIESEFITFMHNLDNNDKMKIFRSLDEKTKKYFIEEERIMYLFYNEMVRYLPNINELSNEEKFDIIFNYVQNRYRNTFTEIDNRNDSDVINVYNNKKGNSSGISKFIKLVTNNNLFNIDSYTVIGNLKTGSKLPIEYNEVVIGSKVYQYDITYGIKKQNEEKLDREIINRDSKVIDLLNKKKEKVIELVPIKNNSIDK